MRQYTRLVFTALLLTPAPCVLAQTGHWEGSVQAPDKEVRIELDLTTNNKGDLVGTFGQPAQGIKGLPLATVAVEGRSVRFVLKADGESNKFDAMLAADGKSMSGDLVTRGYSFPFNLTRTGDARIIPAPKSPPIGKELEGVWNGTLDVGGRPVRLVVTMRNQPGGTATGTIVSVDGSGMEIPIAMTQKAANLTIDVPSVSASYAGVLNAAGTELTGTWTQGPSSLPLTLRK